MLWMLLLGWMCGWSTVVALAPGQARPRMGSLRSATMPPVSKAVVSIRSPEEFSAAVVEAEKGALVVVKFYASWCRACKTIEPRFKRLATEFHDSAQFYEIEFGENKELCRSLGIKKLPCVNFYRGSDECIDTLMAGPSKFATVRAKVEDLVGALHYDPTEVPEFTDISHHYDE